MFCLQELRYCQIRSAKKRIKQQALRQLAFALDSGPLDEVRAINVPVSCSSLANNLLVLDLVS